VIQNQIYCFGSFLEQEEPQMTRCLDTDFLLKLDSTYAKIEKTFQTQQ